MDKTRDWDDDLDCDVDDLDDETPNLNAKLSMINASYSREEVSMPFQRFNNSNLVIYQ